MGYEDLKVDFYALEDSGKTLSELKHEFDDLEHRRSQTAKFWGHPSVDDAMGEFSGNMDYNRRKLTEQIQVTGEQMDSTLKAFKGVDKELYDNLQKSRKQGK